MEVKIMLAAAVFFGGWLCFYLFIRQLIFNLRVAYPLIRKLRSASPDLISIGSSRYTNISTIVMTLFTAVLFFVVIRFCPLYLCISFFVGVLLCFVLLIGKIEPKNRAMFDNFCSAYYQFIPDDELRTAMFNKKPNQMKQRLYNMGLARDFIPEFKEAK